MKVGVIGSGAISDIYLSNMINRFDNLEVAAIASGHVENAKRKGDKYGVPACTVEELLAKREIELVVNLTPVGAHYGIIRAALEAGKHVYTEKTLTGNLEQAAELVRLADEKHLYLGSAPDTFLGSALQTARAALDRGMLGDVHSFAVSANRCNDLLLSAFSFLRKPGAGVLFDYAVYYITALASLLGPIARVGCVTGAPRKTHLNTMPDSAEYGREMDTPNESEVSAVLTMKSGASGTVHIDAESYPADKSYFAIFGTRGILYLSDPNGFGGEVRFLPTPPYKADRDAAPQVLRQFSTYNDNSRGLGPAEMADAIAAGRRARTDARLAYHVEEVLDAMLRGGTAGAFFDIASTMERPAPLCGAKVPVVSIAHLALQIEHDDDMVRFYSEVLGMKRVFSFTQGAFAKSLGEECAHPDDPWISYMKMSDGQFVELFHSTDERREHVSDRRSRYGYMKCNFEVESIEDIKRRLEDAGARITEGVHRVVDGALELSALDPDGNEVQFTEYARAPEECIPLADDAGGVRAILAHVKRTTQAAFQVKDAANMAAFYTQGLGLRKALTLTYTDLYKYMETQGADEAALAPVRLLGDRPWIDYIEAAPRQYIELFYSPQAELGAAPDTAKCSGYQHMCLEVSDMQKAREACLANGITPDTDISLGLDNSYQMWLTDPDGNRIELMQYTDRSVQLM